MGGFLGSNGLMYSNSQRMAMFSRLGRGNCSHYNDDRLVRLGSHSSDSDFKLIRDMMSKKSIPLEGDDDAISRYVSVIPVTKKWAIEKDSKKEEKMDLKLKEAFKGLR